MKTICQKESISKVEIYNKKVFSAELKHSTYKKDRRIWIPYFISSTGETPAKEPAKKESVKSEAAPKSVKSLPRKDDESPGNSKKEESSPKSRKYDLSVGKNIYPVFGKQNQKVKIIDNKLKGRVYYIDPGHGGPDPGAIGKRKGHEMHEDEYAYDVSLRLAKCLLEHGAKVYIIVIDPKDGIRNDEFLKPGYDEYYIGGDTISNNQKIRLKKRADIINKLYKMNKNAISHNTIIIHLDSRVTKERIDIFFYYKEGSGAGESVAETLANTIKQKYEQAQPGRGYNGSVTSRSLLLLREIIPTSTYIELGNIQNRNDQFRFIQPQNRQVIAKWLCDGLLKVARNK